MLTNGVQTLLVWNRRLYANGNYSFVCHLDEEAEENRVKDTPDTFVAGCFFISWTTREQSAGTGCYNHHFGSEAFELLGRRELGQRGGKTYLRREKGDALAGSIQSLSINQGWMGPMRLLQAIPNRRGRGWARELILLGQADYG